MSKLATAYVMLALFGLLNLQSPVKTIEDGVLDRIEMVIQVTWEQRVPKAITGEALSMQPAQALRDDQELPAQVRVGAHQSGAHQVHRAHGLLRELARARLALVDAVDLEGGEDRGNDEQRDEQERPREERH